MKDFSFLHAGLVVAGLRDLVVLVRDAVLVETVQMGAV